MKVIDIVTSALGVCGVLIFLWAALDKVWRQHRLERRTRNEDVAWQQLNDHIDTMRALLGPNYSLESYTKADGSHDIHLECRKCKRKNRLVKGFKDAACSACHTRLVSHSDEAAPATTVQQRNESQLN